ncbi:monooxygenase [Penicillium macrosclerotiorum]|uniref:monooxygenase n=1 Tax=Penicillium macrosclerotiorum TaxID=303699 RepID=UPI0025485EF9|nr:monooxygenase [Penicillium macrosclerotiorum]KAJ5679876.1 monooxygenase [Penicillium macrosclerotiorum]
MATVEDWETTDVLICGCGPTGAMLSGYLGKLGTRNIILEKEAEITTDPRGIALDDDGIRLMQGLGLYKYIFTKIGSNMPRIQFVSGADRSLHKKPFLCFDTASSEGNTGHVGVLAHKQPVLEKYLRTVIDQAPDSELRSSCELTSISEDQDWVYVTYRNVEGAEKRVRARFLAAADGKTGFTRKMYLEPKGIQLEWAEQTRYQETWVALNWKLHLPTKDSHPSFPLWTLGYTPEQVYDLFFPSDFRFLCNPNRPAVCGRFGRPEDRLWRFEFVILPGEDEMEMAGRDKVREVVYPYLTHLGSRFGLEGAIEYPEDCIEVLRCRPFRFSARSCNKWALNRVILCGDAAHVFPPFGGQGITSGFRDAVSLAWRLAIACSSSSRLDYESLLEGWYLERKQQLDKSLASTVRNGDMVNGKSLTHAFIRNWGLWLLQLIPSWRHWLEQGPRGDGPTQYTHTPGMPFMPDLSGGVCFPQTYCTALTRDAPVQFTDDVIFDGKAHPFQLVVLLNHLGELDAALCDVRKLGPATSLLSADEVTFFVPRSSSMSQTSQDPGQSDVSVARVFRSATGDEFARSVLCDSRPLPRGYDESLLWRAASGKRYVILRLDRFVFAVCDSKNELERAFNHLNGLLNP